jgi:uncharacterized tellurite resistance protein B-like protein
MIASLLKRFTAPHSDAPLADSDARLALAALMVRVSQADNFYAPEEAEVITLVLMERYALDRPAAETLRREAETLEASAPDTVRFTRLIKDAVPYEHRDAIAEALWRVVLADDTRDAAENAFLRLVVDLIGVRDVDSARARQRVQAKMASARSTPE